MVGRKVEKTVVRKAESLELQMVVRRVVKMVAKMAETMAV